jgi:hypothetical protein
MGYLSLVGKLDGSNQLCYNVPANMIITGGLVVKKTLVEVDIFASIKDVNNKIRDVFPGKPLSNFFELPGFKGLSLISGDKLYISTDSSNNEILGECIISLYSDNIAGSRVEFPHLIAQTSESCTVGGKLLEITDFLPLANYSVTITSNIPVSNGVNLKLYKWITNTPQFSTRNDPNMIFVGQVPDTGGEVTFQIPETNFYGFSVTAGNPSNSDDEDAACFSWDKHLRTLTINELIPLSGGGGSR